MQAVIPYYYINNNFYKTGIIDYNHNWLIVFYLYKPVNNDKDRDVGLTFLVYKYK